MTEPAQDNPLQHRLADETDKDAVLAWFAQWGTETSYYAAHYDRFLRTKAFALAAATQPLDILDVGAHFLHNAFFYANDGHKVHCVDAPNTMRSQQVKEAAAAMGATLHTAFHLELGDGVAEIPDSSIDLVLFCEIIEHLAFNPVLLWKQIYRTMRDGARIIVTTPNAAFPATRERNLARLQTSGEWGVTVSHILSIGTFGHHWKEFTPLELLIYFQTLSPDFFCRICDPYSEVLLAEIILPSKRHGITIAPPWIPEYS